MALSGLDIYKLLPKTNCRECGFATCLAFAMALAKKAVSIDKCASLSPEAKLALEASAQPPIKLITLGSGEHKLEVGNETVMFRHEEKFHRPCGIGFILDDNLPDAEIIQKLAKINQLQFERVGELLKVNLVAVRQGEDAARFAAAVKLVCENTRLPLVLINVDPAGLRPALEAAKGRRPLVHQVTAENIALVSVLAKEYVLPLVVGAPDLEKVSALTSALSQNGLNDLVLDTGEKSMQEKIWDLTQIRRQALKKSNRSLGYPALVITQKDDPLEEAMEAAAYIAKYASIVLLKGMESWEALALLTLRQNIYTDPQKPLQIEPKLYPVGAVTERSPLLVTTNFSLTYYTVLGEVEASKIPSYILSVDTEGMSVLTAWAAEKFNAEKINSAMQKSAVTEAVKHKSVVIPGYVAVMSGDLEESTGWQVVVGPKEAAGLPSFLKNLQL